jgi:hypothetical protein
MWGLGKYRILFLLFTLSAIKKQQNKQTNKRTNDQAKLFRQWLT